MKLADDWLGIPQVIITILLGKNTSFLIASFIIFLLIRLLGPEDMTNPHVDELSMMTYLSQFPEAELKEGAPLGKKTDISQVKVSGFGGLPEKGAGIGKPADIIVDCSQSWDCTSYR